MGRARSASQISIAPLVPMCQSRFRRCLSVTGCRAMVLGITERDRAVEVMAGKDQVLVRIVGLQSVWDGVIGSVCHARRQLFCPASRTTTKAPAASAGAAGSRHGPSFTASAQASGPTAVVTLVSGSGGGSVSAMGSPARLAVPRPSNSATHALPSRREGKRTAPAPRSKRSAAIVCVMTRRLVVISCRSRCCRSCSSSSSTWRSSISWRVGTSVEVDQGTIELRGRWERGRAVCAIAR